MFRSRWCVIIFASADVFFGESYLTIELSTLGSSLHSFSRPNSELLFCREIARKEEGGDEKKGKKKNHLVSWKALSQLHGVARIPPGPRRSRERDCRNSRPQTEFRLPSVFFISFTLEGRSWPPPAREKNTRLIIFSSVARGLPPHPNYFLSLFESLILLHNNNKRLLLPPHQCTTSKQPKQRTEDQTVEGRRRTLDLL